MNCAVLGKSFLRVFLSIPVRWAEYNNPSPTRALEGQYEGMEECPLLCKLQRTKRRLSPESPPLFLTEVQVILRLSRPSSAGLSVQARLRWVETFVPASCEAGAFSPSRWLRWFSTLTREIRDVCWRWNWSVRTQKWPGDSQKNFT